MKTILLMICMILGSCSAPETPVRFTLDTAIPPMPGSLRMACRPIPELPAKITMGALYENYSELVELYTTCRLANQAKIDWATQNGL